MKLFFVIVLATFSLGGCAPESNENLNSSENPQTSAKFFSMPYLMREMDNGLRVIIVPTEYPDIVTLQIPVQTGSRNEVEAGKTGFAHFFEHMMFRGTDKYPSDAYTNFFINDWATT